MYDLKEYYIFGISFEKRGPQTISISFNDRSFAAKGRNIKYSSTRFILAKSINDFDIEDGVQYIKGIYDHWERDYYIEDEELEPGKYFVFVEIDWHDSIYDPEKIFTIITYGQGFSNIVDETVNFNKTEYLKKLFISKTKTMSKDGLLISDMNDKGAPKIQRFVEYNFPDGYNYIIVLNNDC